LLSLAIRFIMLNFFSKLQAKQIAISLLISLRVAKLQNVEKKLSAPMVGSEETTTRMLGSDSSHHDKNEM
jgi:hypothetical protein